MKCPVYIPKTSVAGFHTTLIFTSIYI